METTERRPSHEAIGTRLLYEDEYCRVWLLELAPGAATPWHVHFSDYVYVVTSEAPVKCEFSGGKAPELQNDKIGNASHKVPDPGHRLVNISHKHYQNVIVELLKAKL